MEFGYILLLIVFITNYDKVNSITTINLNTPFDDDFVSDEESDDTPIGYDGWSSSATRSGETLTYHGWFNAQKYSSFWRYFNIATYGRLSIEFTYIFGCDPEHKDVTNGYGDWAFLEHDGERTEDWTYDSTDDTISDPIALIENCEDSSAEIPGWEKTLEFTTIAEPNSEYLINFTSYLSWTDNPWNEYYGFGAISLKLEEICDFTEFDVDIEVCLFLLFSFSCTSET